ncbi:MAG: hypothetical protein HYZ25_16180 [Chloroflexi bacterium]|nr:hypothetical protein [Chloroflexota bacterium]
MKLLRIVPVLALLLQGCASGPLGSTPTSTPTLPPTVTPSVTPTATITPTPFPTSTPTLHPTQVESGANGLPIFPEASISRGDKIEIAFSQAVLNELDVRAIVIEQAALDDLRQMLLGQWLYILRAPDYKTVNPKDLDSLRRANSLSDGMGIQLEGQYLNVKPSLEIRIDFVRGCREKERDEFTLLRQSLSQQTKGRVLTQGGYGVSTIGRMQGGGGNIYGFTYITSYSIRMVNYVDCLLVGKYRGHAAEAAAEMLRTSAIYSYEIILMYMRHIPGFASDVLNNKHFEYRIITYDKKLIGLAVLGGCLLEEFFCPEGSAAWRFSIMPYGP